MNAAPLTDPLSENRAHSSWQPGEPFYLIADLDLKPQATLLQALQDQEFRPVGSRQTLPIDVRIVATTRANLQAAVAEGRFRSDLYYRLSVVSIAIPPLRERSNEILPLAEFFIEKHKNAAPPARLPTDLCRALIHYSWPGNVQELENIIERWLLLRDPELILDYLETDARRSAAEVQPIASHTSTRGLHDVKEANRRAEIEAILAALNAAHWNRKKAAISLAIDYKSLLYKMKKFGLDNDLYGIASN